MSNGALWFKKVMATTSRWQVVPLRFRRSTNSSMNSISPWSAERNSDTLFKSRDFLTGRVLSLVQHSFYKSVMGLIEASVAS